MHVNKHEICVFKTGEIAQHGRKRESQRPREMPKSKLKQKIKELNAEGHLVAEHFIFPCNFNFSPSWRFLLSCLSQIQIPFDFWYWQDEREMQKDKKKTLFPTLAFSASISSAHSAEIGPMKSSIQLSLLLHSCSCLPKQIRIEKRPRG